MTIDAAMEPVGMPSESGWQKIAVSDLRADRRLRTTLLHHFETNPLHIFRAEKKHNGIVWCRRKDEMHFVFCPTIQMMY